MPLNNRGQAFLPAGAQAIENKRGTAPGIAAQNGTKLIFVLPGVPGEMQQMFEESVCAAIGEIRGRAGGGGAQIAVLRGRGVGDCGTAR